MAGKDELYDVVVIGGGPAGMTSALYCARYNMKVALVFSKLGGAMADAHVVENYPGFKSISGMELAEKMLEHVSSYDNVDVIMDEVTDARKENDVFVVRTYDKVLRTRTIILALGTRRRKLNIENEDRLLGKGISYCATCDGMFFKNKTVAVVGGGDAALDAVVFLSNIASKVYLIHRREEFRAEDIKVESARKKKNIEFVLNCVVERADGKDKLESILVKNLKTGEKFRLDVDGLFIEIGSVPSTALASTLGVELDENGYVKVKEDMSTNVEGVFAAGDITNGSAGVRQISTAVGEGAIAAVHAYKYIKQRK